jgi:hypothetical protein
MTSEEYDRRVLSKAEYTAKYKVSGETYDRLIGS